MRVLVTGAFGNLGSHTVRELVQRGHDVTCFDVPTRANLRAATRLDGAPRLVWGDVRKPSDVAAAVRGQDAVVHLAFVIPKLSATGQSCEDRPEWAYEINVGGTRNLLEACRAEPEPPRFLFASSLHVYGLTQHLPPPRTVSDPVHAVEHYSQHKLACEELVRRSGLRWSITRFAAALPISIRLDSGMYDIPLDNRMEFIHADDVAYALGQILETEDAWGRLLLIGGGPNCQVVYGEIVGKVLEGMGLEALPQGAFSTRPFATDWLDTRESQALLGYQRRTLEDYVRDMRALLGPRRHLIRAFRPLVRLWLLWRSPYWRRAAQVAP